MDTERTIKNLEKNGFAVRYFETAEAAAEYLLSQLHGRTVGIGGSVTIGQLFWRRRTAAAILPMPWPFVRPSWPLMCSVAACL